jgi:predicted RNA-binding Zn-ribbon protein involved in translation (DUF1610 family)
MIQATSRILKSSDVEVEGRFHLDLSHPVSSAQNSRNAAVGTSKVRILENQNEYAVMEVTCPCGRKTIIRCDYSDEASAKIAQPRPEPAAANRTPEKKS